MGAFGGRSSYTDDEAIAAVGADRVSAYDDTTQAIALANTFQALNFSDNVDLDGWAHTPGTSAFTCSEAGEYEATVYVNGERSTGGGSDVGGMRATFNGVEVPASYRAADVIANSMSVPLTSTFRFTGVVAQDLEIEVFGSSTNMDVIPPPNTASATTIPSATIQIRRVA